jgi:hypothetical protein
MGAMKRRSRPSLAHKKPRNSRRNSGAKTQLGAALAKRPDAAGASLCVPPGIPGAHKGGRVPPFEARTHPWLPQKPGQSRVARSLIESTRGPPPSLEARPRSLPSLSGALKRVSCALWPGGIRSRGRDVNARPSCRGDLPAAKLGRSQAELLRFAQCILEGNAYQPCVCPQALSAQHQHLDVAPAIVQTKGHGSLPVANVLRGHIQCPAAITGRSQRLLRGKMKMLAPRSADDFIANRDGECKQKRRWPQTKEAPRFFSNSGTCLPRVARHARPSIIALAERQRRLLNLQQPKPLGAFGRNAPCQISVPAQVQRRWMRS